MRVFFMYAGCLKTDVFRFLVTFYQSTNLSNFLAQVLKFQSTLINSIIYVYTRTCRLSVKTGGFTEPPHIYFLIGLFAFKIDWPVKLTLVS